MHGKHGHIVCLLVAGKHPISKVVEHSFWIFYKIRRGVGSNGGEFAEPGVHSASSVLHESIGVEHYGVTRLDNELNLRACLMWGVV